jgi:hypothetical protein
MAIDSAIREHQAWLGYLQPEGLVVSPAALVDSQVILPRATIQLQERFLPFVRDIDHDGLRTAAIDDMPGFLTEFLEWPQEYLVGLTTDRAVPDSLRMPLLEFGETLEPTFALRRVEKNDSEDDWLLVGKTLPLGTDLDIRNTGDDRAWSASEAQRFERLMRDTGVPVGLLCNGTHIRLLYKPAGESVGALTFPVAAMKEVSGRPILAAFDLLLNRYRLFAAPKQAWLLTILQRSREYQSRVSSTLAQQVLDSLYELLRGFESANRQANGELLRRSLESDPDHVYSGLLSVLLRLVFILFAEDRGLLPNTSIYLQNYSVHGLFERLRLDNERYPDTMDNRYGAWAQLLALFKAVYDGCRHPQMMMPARKGYLFDPDRFRFLDGRSVEGGPLPLVSDGVIYRILSNLVLLDGERLSYRTLDVEQIGSVYQTMIGFKLEVASGAAIALKPAKTKGAPSFLNLDELLEIEPGKRAEKLQKVTDHKLSGAAATALKSAMSLDALLSALERKIARNASADRLPPGSLVLQPTDERRRSGSHYTPRKLTEPIVRKSLEPILKRLRENNSVPTPKQILDLKVCDLAVGSGAFLVEACRQLGDVLVQAWGAHGGQPPIPPDEDEILFARRLIAQRCLYGVDRNPMATDLAKLSLWLATLAKDHPFTFLDHSLRSGDALVGLGRKQIVAFHWDLNAREAKERQFGQQQLEKAIERAMKHRLRILEITDDNPYGVELKRSELLKSDEALDKIRRAGDLCLAAFFDGDKPKARAGLRERYLDALLDASKGFHPEKIKAVEQIVAELRRGTPHPVTPFHWEIEFPEVFGRENGGFDAFIGNPPFMGGTNISETSGMPYFQWLVTAFAPCEHHCDLVAYFFRRSFSLLRPGGTLGLIATNTLAQGDTREGGLRILLREGGQIYSATRRFKWPGLAAVIVSVVHVAKRLLPLEPILDGKRVGRISAYLFDGATDESPARFKSNPYFSLGSKIYGQGFVFNDADPECSPVAERERILREHPEWESRILPYIGGEEINTDPNQRFHRYVICLSDVNTEEELNRWPDLRDIVAAKVRPEREILGSNPNNTPLKKRWWAFQAHRPELYQRLASMKRVVVSSQVSAQFVFSILPATWVFAHTANVFCIGTFSGFAAIQGRAHEVWARFLGSSMKDDLRYTASDCFETFPFPKGWETDAALEAAGLEYYDFRAELMACHNEGLTKTYNRFHDPAETDPGILRLRELHATMDRAVLVAYGWSELNTECEFIPDYYDEAEQEGQAPIPKSIRYRWPDATRDEVLALLLKLNAERAEEEMVTGVAVSESKKSKRGRKVPTTRKAEIASALPTPPTGERTLPSELRLSSPEPLLYTTNLVVALLSERGGNLQWSHLLEAYTLATTPNLMRKHSPQEEKQRVAEWARRWNEQTPQGLLLPSLNQLGAKNLTVTNNEHGRVFHLLDGPRVAATEDIGYDAWLALRITALLVPDTVDIPERDDWTEQVNELVLA